ncbi:hypothetical protein [Pseudomonas sp. Q2-TVG4-2]|uniref:hypothetical protein n=1 Tax=Pseudomonas sp. Q2-TVG4-2 TaxID=1685699 RepID=UPI001C63AD95|nr:hypothetical protein [Pseudomonas sp. Q2-TVG4-2]
MTFVDAGKRKQTSKELFLIEMNPPDRSKRRLQGKSDPTDAENAARTELADNSNPIPKAH